MGLTQEAVDALEELPAEKKVEAYKTALLQDSATDAESSKAKEAALSALVALLVEAGKGEELAALLQTLRPLFQSLPKAKTAKLVRSIIDAVAKIPGTTELQMKVCLEQVEWARAEKRAFLRQRIELRLASLYLETKNYPQALVLISTLLTEVKRLDDKLLLVDVHLIESKVHAALRNLPKAKAGLTAARTAANSIYVPPSLQWQIDAQSGVLHAQEKDYKTAYSYFFEAFEQMSTCGEAGAVKALKYMLLCKIMTNATEDVQAIVNTKGGLKHAGLDTEAMCAVANAHLKRSLKDFQKALDNYQEQLVQDPIIHTHLNALYNTLMEQNLCRLIEPYSRVEIAHLAKLMELPLQQVEAKLSEMILDAKFLGILDQGAGCLLVFEDVPVDKIYDTSLKTITNMSKVVDSLFLKSQKIVA